MPMYVKLDIGQRGNIEAQVKYAKSEPISTFSDASVLVKGRSVAAVFGLLSKHYQGLPIDPQEPSK